MNLKIAFIIIFASLAVLFFWRFRTVPPTVQVTTAPQVAPPNVIVNPPKIVYITPPRIEEKPVVKTVTETKIVRDTVTVVDTLVVKVQARNKHIIQKSRKDGWGIDPRRGNLVYKHST